MLASASWSGIGWQVASGAGTSEQIGVIPMVVRSSPASHPGISRLRVILQPAPATATGTVWGVTRRPAPLPDPLQDTAFSVRQGDAFGLDRGRLRRSDLRSPFVGVRTPDQPADVLGLARAHLPIMAAGEFFSHATAAVLHGMWLPLTVQQELLVHVSVVRPQRAPRNAGVVGHHLITRPCLVRLLNGLPVADATETWCQLARMLELDDLVAAGDWLLRKQVHDADGVRARLLSVAADPHRPYPRRLARAASLTRCGVRSAQETRLRLLLLRGGLPEPEVNADLLDERGGFLAECDLVFREQRVVVEYEGDGHRERRQFRKDVHRYERLQELGWRVVRVTADDLEQRPAETVARIRKALARRSA